jgi:hypothetical protein
MNCQSFENSLTDLARQHPLEATAQAQALEHGRSCSSCALRLEEQRALTAGLRGLAAEMKTIQTPDHLESQLMKAFREGSRQPQRQATARAWYAVAAVAAVLLVVVGVVALRLIWTPQTSPLAVETGSDKPVNHVAPPAVSTEIRPIPEPVPFKPVATHQHSSRRNARRRVKQAQDSNPMLESTTAANGNTVAAEVMTEFMLLGDLSLANLQEGAQLVRVEMPRYAMARLGLPVNMERYDERVKADVWLGADGMARAIRFVQ